jgi:hypothetical protein
MVFSNRAAGIVLKICNDLHVRPESQMYWWDLNKKAVLESLNQKRNDVTAYLKKHFCGKSCMDLLLQICVYLSCSHKGLDLLHRI